jgi:GT2 family glycosyltransferase
VKEMNSSVSVIALCGRERDSWINPALMMKVVECVSDGLMARRPVAIGLKCGVSPVTRARNQIVQEFLASPGSWLIQIDNDTVPPEHFLRLIDCAEAEGKLVFGVPTPMITNNLLDDNKQALSWNVGNREKDDCLRSNFFVTLPRGWNKCDFVGGAFLVTHRSVLEKIGSDWFDLIPQINCEDFSFCQRARNAGFQTWFNGDYQCDHIKSLSLLPSMEKSCESHFDGLKQR